MVYENLRDLNFEHQAGKLPDQDFQSLKASLEDEAAGILAEMARLERPLPAPLQPKGNQRLKFSPKIVASALAILLSSAASAQTFTGTLKRDHRKPAAGDEVILIKLGQGMEEAAAPRPTPAATSASSSRTRPASHSRDPSGRDLSQHGASGKNSVEVQVFDVPKSSTTSA